MMGKGMGEAVVRWGVASKVIGHMEVVGTMVGFVMGLMVGFWMVGLVMVGFRVVGLWMVVGLMMVWFWMVRFWMVGFWVVVGFRVVVGFWMVVGLRMVGLVMVVRWRSIMNYMVHRAWCMMHTQTSRPKPAKAIRPKAPCTS